MYNCILILTLLFLILLIKKKQIKENFIINNNEWLDYRLADVIKGYIYKMEPNYINKLNKNSIANLYIRYTKNSNNKINNFKILKKIIDKKIKDENIEIPNNNQIILHLRIGDVIYNFDKNLKINNKYHYVTDLNKLKYLLQKLNNNKEIILIYGSHKKKINKDANIKYINNIKHILKSNNFRFREKISGNPDKDFIYMCNSKIFIKSGGGYSKIIADYVKFNNNIVLKP